MTTKEIADRYYELALTGQIQQIQDELYATDALSIEPENDSQLPREVKGIQAMREKEQKYNELIEMRHGGSCGIPIVTDYHFACTQDMDVTLKDKGRKVKQQMCIFEVRDGKITTEEFFYNDFV